MSLTYGDFLEQEDCPEYLIVSFSSSFRPTGELWRANSLSADFLADYWGTFFPAHEGASEPSEVKDAVSFIANELLENALKCSFKKVNLPVRVGLYLSETELKFYVTNSIAPDKIAPFQRFINQIMTVNTGELYFRQLEKNAGDEMDGYSGLGFLTMMNDYNAGLAWKFDKEGKDSVDVVTTMVRIEIVRGEKAGS